MDIVCNELSFYPLATTEHEAEVRFRMLLETFKAAKKKYGFTHIRFPVDYHVQMVTETLSYSQWVVTVKHKTIQSLIAALFRRPYTDDLNNAELGSFYSSTYSLTSPLKPIQEPPIGIPVAFIKSVPTISFDTHPFWRHRILEFKKSDATNNEEVIVSVYNACLKDDFETKELDKWADIHMSDFINSEEMLRKYLGFVNYQVEFDGDFLKQAFDWKEKDSECFRYLLMLMKDVELHPFTGGMGQTENLKYRGKEASKRVTQKDRLSYSIINNIVYFMACKGHYDFH